MQILFAILISMFSGPGPAAIAEIFPTRTRSTWMTSGLRARGRDLRRVCAVHLGVADQHVQLADRAQFYLIAAAIVSTIVIATLRETAHEPLG